MTCCALSCRRLHDLAACKHQIQDPPTRRGRAHTECVPRLPIRFATPGRTGETRTLEICSEAGRGWCIWQQRQLKRKWSRICIAEIKNGGFSTVENGGNILAAPRSAR